jgi:hypothetical protein
MTAATREVTIGAGLLIEHGQALADVAAAALPLKFSYPLALDIAIVRARLEVLEGLRRGLNVEHFVNGQPRDRTEWRRVWDEFTATPVTLELHPLDFTLVPEDAVLPASAIEAMLALGLISDQAPGEQPDKP